MALISVGPAKPLKVPPVAAIEIMLPLGVPRKMPEPPAVKPAPNDTVPELFTPTLPLKLENVPPVEAMVVSAPPAPMKMPEAVGVLPAKATVLPALMLGPAPKFENGEPPPVAAMVVKSDPSLAKMP